MPDYGHDIEFGYFLTPDAGDPKGVLETARLADRLGYDLLAVQDHPYQPAHLDTLALLGVILGQTERIRVFQDVGNLPLRPPGRVRQGGGDARAAQPIRPRREALRDSVRVLQGELENAEVAA